MKKSFIVVAVILLILTYTIASTYAVIIDITDTDGESEIVNVINILIYIIFPIINNKIL